MVKCIQFNVNFLFGFYFQKSIRNPILGYAASQDFPDFSGFSENKMCFVLELYTYFLDKKYMKILHFICSRSS